MDESVAVCWLSFLPLQWNDLIFHHTFFLSASLSSTAISSSSSTQHRCSHSAVRQPYLSVCVCVFVFSKEPVCWFVGVCAFCVCLARPLTEQIKSMLYLRERTKSNRLSVKRIDFLVIHRYSLQQFLFFFDA